MDIAYNGFCFLKHQFDGLLCFFPVGANITIMNSFVYSLCEGMFSFLQILRDGTEGSYPFILYF